MRKYDLYGGLRDAELSIEKLNALARETASRAVRDGRSAFYKANARAAKDDRRAIEDANAALEAANGSGTELPVGADEFADSFYIIEKPQAKRRTTRGSLARCRLKRRATG